MFKSAAATHIGHVRSKNEDSLIDNRKLALWGVADGVGGNRYGDFASEVTCQTIERKLRLGQSLKEAIDDAHQLVLKLGTEKSEVRGMASTVVAAHYKNARLEVCWVGDSRAYLVTDTRGEGPEGKLVIEQLTTDHNQAQLMFEQGEIGFDELRTHPAQRVLLNAVGGKSHGWKVDTVELPLKQRQTLLLCSDGLSGELDDSEICSSFEPFTALADIADNLVEKALVKGGSDNITVVLVALDASTTHYLPETAETQSTTIDTYVEGTDKTANYSMIKYTIIGVLAAFLFIVLALWFA